MRSISRHRAIAHWLCSVLHAMMPKHLREWADAIRTEIAEIEDDGEAMRFAFRGFCGLIPRVLLMRFFAALVAMTGSGPLSGETTTMNPSSRRSHQPRLVGLMSALVATGLGLAYMTTAGAPAVYLGINLAALAIGLAILATTVRVAPMAGRWRGFEIFAMAATLLATSLVGHSVEGAARWFAVGPLFVQTSLIVLPVMIVGFARTRTVLATVGMSVAALALALQPDRAMAGVLVAGLAALAFFRLDRFVGAALTSASVAFMVTLNRPDTLPAAPYVDQVLFSAFDAHPLAGVAVWIGAALLLAPALVGWRADPRRRGPALVFGAVWFAVVLAAALGNYPTPVVGYGGSAIIGYLLCLAALPKSVAARTRTECKSADARDRERSPWKFRVQAFASAALLMFGASSAAGEESERDCVRPEIKKVEIPNTEWRPGPGGQQIPLWPEGHALRLPDYGGNAEMIGNGSPLIAGRTWNWATYVARPTMTIYRPSGRNTGAAMLVLPGGGYAAVAMDLEGTEICDWITRHGVTCAILKYRAPQVWRGGEPPAELLALQDAQRAMGLLRQRAADYGVDPDRIGVIGFSAGAHLAASASNADARTYDAVDAADQMSLRPNFAVMLYTGRLWDRAAPRTSLTLAPWVAISPEAPPTLLIHAMNDPVNDVRHSMAYGLALQDAGVAVDMRVFAQGCHAFGLRPTAEPITRQWPGMVLQWLQDAGVLRASVEHSRTFR